MNTENKPAYILYDGLHVFGIVLTREEADKWVQAGTCSHCKREALVIRSYYPTTIVEVV